MNQPSGRSHAGRCAARVLAVWLLIAGPAGCDQNSSESTAASGSADTNKPQESAPPMSKQSNQDKPNADSKMPRVRLATTLGDIVLELDSAKAPITTENFLRYARDGFYEGLIFHRVIPKFMAQGGGFDTDSRLRQPTYPPIKNEWQNGLKNKHGTIAMARIADPDSASSQFFINLVDNNQLDQPMVVDGKDRSGGAGYAVFGRVVDGMDVVDLIAAAPCKPNPGTGDSPCPDPMVVIKAATVE